MNRHLGPIFRLHRRESGLRLAQFKEIVPVSKLSDFETGKKDLTHETVKKLYAVIGMEFIRLKIMEYSCHGLESIYGDC